MKAYRLGVALFACLFIGLGISLIVVTALRGGGIGFLLGGLFVVLGAGRLWLLTR